MDYSKVLNFLGESIETKKIKESDIGYVFKFNMPKDKDKINAFICFEFDLESISKNSNFAGSLDYLNNLEMPYEDLALCVEASAELSLKVSKTALKALGKNIPKTGEKTPYTIIFDSIKIDRIFSADMSNNAVQPDKILQDHMDELKHLEKDILEVSKQLILKELDSVYLLDV